MHFIIHLLLLFLFLIGTAFLSALNAAFRKLHFQDPNYEPSQKEFFYRSLHNYLFPKHEYEGLLTAAISAQNITRCCFAISSLLLLLAPPFIFETYSLRMVAGLSFFIALLFFLGEFIPRILASRFPETALKISAPLSSFFMLIALPITYLSLKLAHKHFQSISFEEPLTKTKREIIEIIQRAKLEHSLDINDKKLIESVLRFKDRIAREIMVPRVDVFGLSADTPIRTAARLIEEEGYSRIPIYRNNVDNIVGVLMYKDILRTFMVYQEKNNDPAILDAPIESIQKSVLYTPETKKISHLLLEFRKKQVHLAIVVDEYGGTEGIVTIEDILEEIVGDIEDEYDEEEDLFFPQQDGSWVVDARMSIYEVEEQMGIKIPEEGDYDTVGGYIFHCAGSIPSKGFIIHQDEFEMEILRSDERKVERVRVRPILKPHSDSEAKEA